MEKEKQQSQSRQQQFQQHKNALQEQIKETKSSRMMVNSMNDRERLLNRQEISKIYDSCKDDIKADNPI